MENKPATNVFSEVHRKIQAAKDKARKAKEVATNIRNQEAARDLDGAIKDNVDPK
jgi:hypothetical protein